MNEGLPPDEKLGDDDIRADILNENWDALPFLMQDIDHYGGWNIRRVTGKRAHYLAHSFAPSQEFDIHGEGSNIIEALGNLLLSLRRRCPSEEIGKP